MIQSFISALGALMLQSRSGRSSPAAAVVVLVLWALVLLGCSEPKTGSTNGNSVILNVAAIAPDNRSILVNWCPGGPDCRLALHDLDTNVTTVFEPPTTDMAWISASFAPDGRTIATATARRGDGGRTTQLGIIDIESKGNRDLTNSQTRKRTPRFSPDRQRLIFAQAARERPSGRTRFVDWDLYTFDLRDGTERRLTNFQFFLISEPFYFPDGNRFLFSADGPRNYISPTGKKGNEGYRELYQDNNIFIMKDLEPQDLIPAFRNGSFSGAPSISSDGQRILYKSITNELDHLKCCYYNYDLFVYENGTHRRLTAMQSMINSSKLSPDGSVAAFAADDNRKGNERLWLLDIATGQSREIAFPSNLRVERIQSAG